ncbi:ribokinase [Terrabacter sp. GCM10028922]|uniref:ribokinase n=1 Tax=Terrabacter sp. GCM10028922 TaxID=3273428 RepID=UPI00360D3F32
MSSPMAKDRLVSHQGRVTVLGSANLDLIVRTARIPRPGETLTSHAIRHAPGGKGLNQAVAASRAGASVRFVGAVGNNATGAQLAKYLQTNQIDTTDLATVTADSGTAIVMVDDNGENAILVTPGANGAVTPLPSHPGRWLDTDVLLMQLELPLSTIEMATAEAARSAPTTRVVLNAAPARRLPRDLLGNIDVLIVNEHECRELTSNPELPEAARELAQNVAGLVVTLGARGATWFERGHQGGSITPPKVTPVDTTGAGDTFCGALAAELAAGASLETAIAFGVAASALSTQQHGASDSAPHRQEVLGTMEAGRHVQRAP